MMPAATIEKMMKNTTPEERKTGMEEWGKWMKKHKKDLIDMGAPLGKTKRVDKNGITDAKNEIGGYSIVKAKSHEAAAALFKDNPHFKMDGAYIEILDIVAMPDMQ